MRPAGETLVRVPADQRSGLFRAGDVPSLQRGYAEILRKLTDGLRDAVHAGALQVAGTSAVSKARARLGPEPLKALFEQVRGPLTTPQSPGAFAFGRRLLMLSLDGTVLAVAPTPANAKAFGPPPPGGSHRSGRRLLGRWPRAWPLLRTGAIPGLS
jgi:hypothetical protein